MFKEKCVGIVSERTMSIVCDINQNGGEPGDNDTTQMIRIAINKQKKCCMLSFKRIKCNMGQKNIRKDGQGCQDETKSYRGKKNKQTKKKL